MFKLLRRLIYLISNKIRLKDPDKTSEQKFTVRFSKMDKPYFDIKSESSYNVYLSNGSLEAVMKKSNCIAWIDIPNRNFRDQAIEAKLRLDSLGGYAATGIVFRKTDEENYYIALVSSKGYFRLDVVINNSPKTLIAWTEILDFDGTNIKFNMVAYGAYMIFIINDKWVCEADDNSTEYGQLGIAIASYDDESKNTSENQSKYTCKINLDYIIIDTHDKVIKEIYQKWTDSQNVNAESRLRLAETYAVMGDYVKALDQINKAWKRRDEAIRDVVATDSEVRTKTELLLAAQMSFNLGRYDEAEKFYDAIIERFPVSTEAGAAYMERMKMLNEQNKFKELKLFVIKNSKNIKKDIDYYTILGRCFWELKDYINSATAWSKAYEINRENGVYAVNAANALELAGRKNEALARFMDAGRIFLNEGNDAELAVVVPKLSYLGKQNWETRALIGKWAYSLEDYEKCLKEFSAADKLRKLQNPVPREDPAMLYLWGLVYYIKGNNQIASIKNTIRFLEKAVKLAPDYELFQTKLEEFKTILSSNEIQKNDADS